MQELYIFFNDPLALSGDLIVFFFLFLIINFCENLVVLYVFARNAMSRRIWKDFHHEIKHKTRNHIVAIQLL